MLNIPEKQAREVKFLQGGGFGGDLRNFLDQLVPGASEVVINALLLKPKISGKLFRFSHERRFFYPLAIRLFLYYPEGVCKKQLETGTVTAIVLSVVVGFVLGYIARESFQDKIQNTQESQVERSLQANDNPDISVNNPLIGGDVELPIVVFNPPGKWVDQEALKRDLIKKEVQPRHDYYNVFNEDVNNDMNGGSTFVTAVFTKETDGSIDLKTYYSNANYEQGSASIKYTWIPSCYGGCKLSEEFLEKYPEAK